MIHGVVLARSQQRGGASRPIRGSQTESSGSETDTESESDSESYEEDNQPATVNTVTVLPRKKGENGGQAEKEGGKGGGKSKVPAGAIRVLPDSGGKRGGREREKEEGEGREMAEEEETSWDRYILPTV